jgi:beta-lactam-binding protein with PASTA domain
MSVHRVAIVVLATLALAGCGSGASEPKRVPRVVGLDLKTAQDRLDDRGLRYETVGGGTFGVVVRSRWAVCRQQPGAGKTASSVTLFIARTCSAGVPHVVGLSLEDADDRLDAAGVSWRAETPDGEPVLVKHLWEVCDQTRAPGRALVLSVERDCGDGAS